MVAVAKIQRLGQHSIEAKIHTGRINIDVTITTEYLKDYILENELNEEVIDTVQAGEHKHEEFKHEVDELLDDEPALFRLCTGFLLQEFKELKSFIQQV